MLWVRVQPMIARVLHQVLRKHLGRKLLLAEKVLVFCTIFLELERLMHKQWENKEWVSLPNGKLQEPLQNKGRQGKYSPAVQGRRRGLLGADLGSSPLLTTYLLWGFRQHYKNYVFICETEAMIQTAVLMERDDIPSILAKYLYQSNYSQKAGIWLLLSSMSQQKLRFYLGL